MSSKIEVPPEIYYSGENADKATDNPHYVQIQRKLTERAMELIDVDSGNSQLILDVGCGTSISGQVFSENGHFFVGVDIAPEMLLRSLQIIPGSTGNQFLRADVGAGLPFRAGVFDCAIGIDVIRWLLANYDGCDPVPKRLKRFFETLHGALRCGGKAIFNFHPETSEQAEMLSSIATKCGFGGGIHTDFPNSNKAKVHWLLLEVGGVSPDQVDEQFTAYGCVNVDAFKPRHQKKKGFNRVEWIKKKKERQRLLGKKVANDSKYTGRSRRRWI